MVEPEFDAIERDHWQALEEYEDALCPQCKRLLSICQDPDQTWYPQRHVCNVTVAQTMTQRRFARATERIKPDGDGWHPADGVTIWMSEEDLTPDDNFLNELQS